MLRPSYLLLVIIATYLLQEPFNKVVSGLTVHEPLEDEDFTLKPLEVELERIENNIPVKLSGFENDYREESLEEECPEGQWWHLRGERCVPYRCIGGKKYRDVMTGECLITHSWYVRGPEKGFRKYVPRTLMRNKARTRFALPTKIKG